MIRVGRISGPQGLKGEVRLKSFTGDPQAIAAYGPLTTGNGETVVITRLRPVKGGFAARLDRVADRDQAEALGKTDLFIHRERLPEPEKEEYYHSDLIGLEVRAQSGEMIGQIRAVQDFGGGAMLEIFRPGARDTALVPFTAQAVPLVDIAGGYAVVTDDALDQGDGG